MKEYFSHDYFSRNDPKLVNLRMKLGFEGVGIYWSLVEIMYEQGGNIKDSELNCIAFELHLKCERIANVLQSYDLFYFKDGCYYSESVNKRLGFRLDKSDKARKSANKRWENTDKEKVNADAMPTQSEGNAIKGKESIKESKIIEKKEFAPLVFLTQDQYQNLCLKHTQEGADWMIQKLSAYKESSGKKYKSDEAAIRSWVLDKWTNEPHKPQQVTKLPY